MTALVFRTAPPPDPASPRLSDAIAVARVLCILGIVYAHAWTGLGGSQLAAASQTAQGILRWILLEVFGRSAVPLLGMISGWLVAGSTRTGAYRTFVLGKAQTILLPMVLWNALSLVLVSGAAYLGWLRAPVPHHLGWVLNELFCLSSPSEINVQMAFLRDLFLCAAAAPLLLRLRCRWLVGSLILVTVWVLSNWSFPLLLRPQILQFFIIGILIRQRRLAARSLSLPLIWAVPPFALLITVKIALSVQNANFAGHHAHWFALLDMLTRLSASIIYWRAAWALAGSSALVHFRRIEPYAFLMFCAHVTIMWLAGPVLERLVGPLGSPAYPALLLLQPALVLVLTVALGQLLIDLAPMAADHLSGGRLRLATTGRR